MARLDCTSSEQLDKSWWAALRLGLGADLEMKRTLASPVKIKQATAWRECSLGDDILTLSSTYVIIWVMNACYSFHRQLTLMYLRIKVKIALRNGCEDHVASNYMIGLTAFKYCEIDMMFFFQTCDDPIFFGKWSNHIKSIFVHSIWICL